MFQFWNGSKNKFLNKYIINKFCDTFANKFCGISPFVKCFLKCFNFKMKFGKIRYNSKTFSKTISKRLKFCKLQIIFQTGNRLKNYFRFKDRVPETLQSNFVYKFKYGSCTASYYGKTYRHIKVRVSKHQGVYPRIGKRVKGTLST